MSNGLAFTEHPRSTGEIGATEQIAQILQSSGLDAPATLYDESLAYAQEGKLAAATERLRMLLCLDPTDTDASMLLGKVLATRNQWQEALAYIDSAINNGAVAEPGLRDHVETNLRRQVEADEQRRARVTAREQGEILTLRSEAKRLRSDNAALDAQVDDLQKRIRIWSSVTALIAGSASALLIAALLFGGGGSESTEPVAAEATTIAQPTPSVVTAPAAVTPAAVAPAAVAPEPEPLNTAPVASDPNASGQEFPATHTVKRGDTLGQISMRYYGKASLYSHIKQANDMTSEDLQLGQKLLIPEPPEDD
ncbi:MAG: LysM peptidoglycan-binding domain-containing protein [Myxococcota bacterium]|nr:LysM peptidoglycan-binding domain-containing protein [Myxococcota bacterium]